MPNLKERILDVVNKGPSLSGFATITKDGKPWVRYVMSEVSDDLSFRFASFTNARKIAQIESDPEVHLTCGITDPTNMRRPYLQIQGHAEFTTDLAARHAYWSERLRVLFQGPDDPNYGVVTVRAYRIEYCIVGLQTEVWERDGYKQSEIPEPGPTVNWCEG
ncbi:MAG TPA: pyridoxamine 5'-phosphate oxidase family protein [Chthoniobacterales bacterium]|jgi:general stress protein 26|nr:pyridoxamine 5'-phosphate oxidase family protein [Chthoniobacterales bacterium]